MGNLDLDKDKNYYSKNKKNKELSIFFAIFSLIIALIVFSFIFFKRFDSYYISTQKTKHLKKLWEDKFYLDTINYSEKILQDNPIDKDALFYGGLSSFYYLFEIPDDFEDKRKQYREKSLKYLRLYRVIENLYNSQIDYVIGLIYYYEGDMFKDLSKKYLLKFYEKNPDNQEVIVYLGLVFAKSESQKDINESNNYFLELINKNFQNKDLLYVEIAKNYIKLSNFLKAEEYIDLFLETKPSKENLEQIYFLKARILMLEGKIDLALQEYDRILELYDNSSDAHYYRGELYEKLGRSTEARFEWREALRLDPYNKKAIEKLQS